MEMAMDAIFQYGRLSVAGVSELRGNGQLIKKEVLINCCLLYTSPSPRDLSTSRMPSSA